ncbi:fatty acid desaturase-domain-containing protein [Lipomyces arxii]|uniref:fatty acid desaturase-domain-containing protein n=1 Tax=Lipomyces arxii TaxID=56418 RepID=UPI0034CD4A85
MSTVTYTERESATKEVLDTYGNVFTAPEYTMKDILDAIPKRCFERSLTHSMLFVLRDFFYVAVLVTLALQIPNIPSVYLRGIAWAAYTVAQGIVGTGIWVLAHECGHGAFSPYKIANDIMGWFMHSLVLVPYHSWRISHSKHHKATGNLARDMVFVPKSKERYMLSRNIQEATEEMPIVTLYWLFIQQAFGFPTYLIANVTGQKYSVSKLKLNHYIPSAPMFDEKDFWDIIISDVGIAISLTLSWLAIQNFGLFNYSMFYFIPYLWVNHWLVCITYLQHTDASLPHYDDNEWTFAKGAAATIDRDFGFIGRHFFHEIIETHVAHHYSSRMPFYHAEEATKAIRKVMGKHYKQDKTNMLVSLYRSARACQFVEGDGIKMYRNFNGIGPTSTEEVKKTR